MPPEKMLLDINGSGASFGKEVGVRIRDDLSSWAGGDYFLKKRNLTFSQEETIINIVPNDEA